MQDFLADFALQGVVKVQKLHRKTNKVQSAAPLNFILQITPHAVKSIGISGGPTKISGTNIRMNDPVFLSLAIQLPTPIHNSSTHKALGALRTKGLFTPQTPLLSNHWYHVAYHLCGMNGIIYVVYFREKRDCLKDESSVWSLLITKT